MADWTRREVLGTAAGTLAAIGGTWLWPGTVAAQEKKGDNIRFGLVTYQWGKDWTCQR